MTYTLHSLKQLPNNRCLSPRRFSQPRHFQGSEYIFLRQQMQSRKALRGIHGLVDTLYLPHDIAVSIVLRSANVEESRVHTYMGIVLYIRALVFLIKGNSGASAAESLIPHQAGKKFKLLTFLRSPYCEAAKMMWSQAQCTWTQHLPIYPSEAILRYLLRGCQCPDCEE